MLIVNIRGRNRLRFYRPGLPVTGSGLRSGPALVNFFLWPGLPACEGLSIFFQANIIMMISNTKKNMIVETEQSHLNSFKSTSTITY